MAEAKENAGLSKDQMDLLSRQIGAFGIEMMGKLVQMRVLIVGLNGVGVETAKNLILAGPKAVTVHDDEKVRIEDLGTNFYLSEKDVGTNRAEACLEDLSTLNPYVQVKANKEALGPAVWSQYNVVCYTSNTTPLSELVKADKFCRENKVVFIYGAACGLTCTLFSDFGKAHVITDEDGEPTRTNVIEDITADGIVTVAGDRHGMDDGDTVRFEEVEGMVELNKLEKSTPIKRVYRKTFDKKTVLVPNKFQIDLDCTSFGKYTNGGVVLQVKEPKVVEYLSLEEAVVKALPKNAFMMPHMHMEKMLMKNQGAQLHYARRAIWAFVEANKGLPKLHDKADAAACVKFAKDILAECKDKEGALVVDSIDEEIVTKTALYARAELPGFTAFLGGVLAQEIVKYPGKYSPINQWFHHDAMCLVGDDVPKDGASVGSRYDWQINVFGKAFQDKLFAQKWFLVGAGALGCEYIKGMALMGLGAGDKGGYIHLTDMDRIEVSNLNRQFLFRRDNVGQPKSVCAAAAAKKMNPAMNIICHEIPVGFDTEDHFNDKFWSSLDGVWNALDNVKARQYTDGKCVFHLKPLLESGTLGTKANSEIIIPHKTTCYNDHKEVKLDAIPMCTLRNFPHFIEHCIEWARAQFSELFEESAQGLNALLADREKYFDQVKKEGDATVQLEKLEVVKSLYDFVKGGVKFEDCVGLALEEYTKQYRDRILELKNLFPEDARKIDPETKEDLGPFWSGHKRFPQCEEFDAKNELHLDYVLNTANLFAYTFGIKENRDRAAIAKMATEKAKGLKPWVAKEGVKIQVDEGEEVAVDDEQLAKDKARCDELYKFFRDAKLEEMKALNVADFEKDDDTNFHIDFITACSNLRAWNYRIKQASRHKCKMIAGKIIPALATTTAMITGLVELELYKMVLGLPFNKFENTNVNLAVNQFQSFEPSEAKKAQKGFDDSLQCEVLTVPEGFTVWDKVVINKGDLTVEEFLKEFTAVHYGCTLTVLFAAGITNKMIKEGKGKFIYTDTPFGAIKETILKNMKRSLKDVYIETYGPLPSKDTRYLVLAGDVEDKDMNPCNIPKIVYYFK